MQNVSENSLDLINQGCALMAQQQYEQALAKFLLAQKDSPKYIDCYVNLGNVYSCLEKYDDALENFKKALMLDEKSSTVLFDIGNIMYLKGDKIEAVKYYNKEWQSMLKEKVSKPASLRYRTQLNSFRLLLLKSTRQWVIFLHIGRVLLMTKLLPPISTNIRHC